jgi:tetratricopeptide (TPR) repeat protein
MGRVDEAIDHLERGLAIRDTHRFDMYVVAQGDGLLARAYAAKLRESGGAVSGAAIRSFERRVARAVASGKRFPAMQSAAWLARGLLASRRGEARQAMAWFDESAKLAERLGARLWQADAYLEGGLALMNSDARTRATARARLVQAHELLQRCGARPGAQTAAAALERIDDSGSSNRTATRPSLH